MNSAFTISNTWMVAMASQRRSLVHLVHLPPLEVPDSKPDSKPDDNRSRVRANAVLLHTEAKRDRVPMKLPSKPMAGRVCGGRDWK